MSLVYDDTASKVLFKLMFNCGRQEKPSILTSRTLLCMCGTCVASIRLDFSSTKKEEKNASNFLSIFHCENNYAVTWYESGISLVDVYERGRKICHFGLKMACRCIL